MNTVLYNLIPLCTGLRKELQRSYELLFSWCFFFELEWLKKICNYFICDIRLRKWINMFFVLLGSRVLTGRRDIHTNMYWNHCELRISQMCLCAYICVYVFMYVFMCVNVNVLCVSIYMLVFPTSICRSGPGTNTPQ